MGGEKSDFADLVSVVETWSSCCIGVLVLVLILLLVLVLMI